MARAAMRDPRPFRRALPRAGRLRPYPCAEERTSRRDRRSSGTPWTKLIITQSTGAHLVGPYPEARQRVGTEGAADRDVGSVAAARDQDPADARSVVARVENVPMPAEERLEPGSEVHGAVWRRHPDIAQVAGAVACRDVHAPAEGNGQVRIVAADAGPVVKGFQRCPCHARVLIAEGDMSMDIVADGLNPAPSRWRLPEEIPRRLGKPIGFAVPASEQEGQRFLGQILHRNLLRLRRDQVGGSGIVHEGAAGDARATPWGNDAGAPVAKAVTIGRYRDRRVDHQVVTADEIGHACEVDVEVEYHRGWLRTVVDHFEADANLHHGPPIGMVHSLQTSRGVHAVEGTP